MELVTQLRYSESMVRLSVRAYWWRTTGWRFFITLLLISIGFGYLLISGDRGWYMGFLGAVLFIGIAMSIAVYVVHFNNGMAKLRAMGEPVATLRVSDSEISFESGAGSGSLPWRAITEVWKLPHIWLLMMSKAQFVTLPLDGVDEVVRDFILDRVRAAGGTIRE